MQIKLYQNLTHVPVTLSTKIEKKNSYVNKKIGNAVSKFISCLIIDGKKATSETIFFKSFIFIKTFLKSQNDTIFQNDPLKVFLKALDNVKPVVETKSVKKSGRAVQVPKEIPEYRRLRLAIRWIIEAAKSYRTRGKGKKTNSAQGKKKQSNLAKKHFSERLYMEIIKAALGKGKAIDKKHEMHRRAYLQRANTKYKW